MLSRFINHTEFTHPWVLWFLAALPLLFAFSLWYGKRKESWLPVSSTKPLILSWKTYMRLLPLVLRFLAFAAIIVALARPRSFNDQEIVNSEGIDIVLCMDISGSMNYMDLTPTRLDAAKEVAASFIRKRRSDRIGLVVFSAEAFTPCPVTTHYEFLLESVYQVQSGMLSPGTHIGEGLGTAVSGLEKSKSKTKLVVLLTDGNNDPNEQDVSPDEATALARSLGVKVYTIGVGKEGKAPMQQRDRDGNIVVVYSDNTIDEPLLQRIAGETGGKYYRATDNAALQQIYDEIDQLEKVPIQSTQFRKYTERYFPFVWAALGLLLLEIILRYTVFRKFP